MTSPVQIEKITSRQNPWYKDVRDWSHSSGVHKDKQKIWLEGDHLCEAARLKGFRFDTVVFREDCPQDLIHAWSDEDAKLLQVSASVMEGLSSLHSPPMMAAIAFLPIKPAFDPHVCTVVLDQLQDPGNAGSILRSAAAFGFKQMVATPLTVGLWTHKVVRAAMGAHFTLNIIENLGIKEIQSSQLSVVLTSSHQGLFLDELVANKKIPFPRAWIFGHEGRGHSLQWADKLCQTVRIKQPGGEESLNVAAAAAICLHASATQCD
jgi:TrmH family RNA methyltransferase